MNSLTWSDAEALCYIASYADLTRELGIDPQAGRDHYARFGAAQGLTIRFKPLAYIASYPDLISAYGADPETAARHFIKYGFAEGRSVSFDAYEYLAANPDLIFAYGADPITATYHYIRYGLGEGRSVEFDNFAYLAANPDLIPVFRDDVAAATRHYVQAGAASDWHLTSFDALSYVAANADLIDTYGSDLDAATRHYVLHGFDEGRLTDFDSLRYVASNTDLIVGIGTDGQAAARYYITQGYAQGDRIDFDATGYLLSQPDLIAAGLGAYGALEHWITHGYREGRTGDAAFGREQDDHLLFVGQGVDGRIDTPQDRDWYEIDLSAGDLILFTATGSGVSLSVHDLLGNRLAVERTAEGWRFLAPQTSYYLVTVEGAETGDYAIIATPDVRTITGTDGWDWLSGSHYPDIILGLGAGDVIVAGAGNDIVEGGQGNDDIEGGPGDDILYGNTQADDVPDNSWDFIKDWDGGNDELYGQGGNDSISLASPEGAAPRFIIADGGPGNDVFTYGPGTPYVDTIIYRGGEGDDYFYYGGVGLGILDAGPGNDTISFNNLQGGDHRLTLGEGRDVIEFSGSEDALTTDRSIAITDFKIGEDRISITSMLLDKNITSADPFATGHLRLVQVGTNVRLEIDQDGTGSSYGFVQLAQFENSLATSFTAAELGYAPTPASVITGAETMVIA